MIVNTTPKHSKTEFIYSEVARKLTSTIIREPVSSSRINARYDDQPVSRYTQEIIDFMGVVLGNTQVEQLLYIGVLTIFLNQKVTKMAYKIGW